MAADIEWFFLGFPIGLFEVVIGIWLIVKGVPTADEPTHSPEPVGIEV